MTEETALVRRDPGMPALTVAQVLERHRTIAQVKQEILVEDVHYGTIPGTKKPTLYQAGAEQLAALFDLIPHFVIEREIEDWDNGFFYYRISCELSREGKPRGDAGGSCNSKESGYAWRWVSADNLRGYSTDEIALLKTRASTIRVPDFALQQRKTPDQDSQYGKTEERWDELQDLVNLGRCESKERPSSRGVWHMLSIVDRQYRIPNEDIYDLANTVLKMAEKRALVNAIKTAAGVSAFFTQDLEDVSLPGVAAPRVEDMADVIEGEVLEKDTDPMTAPIDQLRAQVRADIQVLYPSAQTIKNFNWVLSETLGLPEKTDIRKISRAQIIEALAKIEALQAEGQEGKEQAEEAVEDSGASEKPEPVSEEDGLAPEPSPLADDIPF